MSSAQIDIATKNHPKADAQEKAAAEKNLDFVVGAGDSELPFGNKTVDLVSCCQAIHWLNIPQFYREVDRVLKPKEGLLVIYGYHLTGPCPSIPAAKSIEKLRDEVYDILTYLLSKPSFNMPNFSFLKKITSGTFNQLPYLRHY